MPPQHTSVVDYLNDQSELARQWPGYVARPEQTRLAEEVARGIDTGVSLALEAPTGTGKTLSYLLPALLSSRRVIISVGNLTLQDHLWLGEYQKLRLMLPQLRALTVLKGCDNYLCLYRYDALQAGEGTPAALTAFQAHWSLLTDWLTQTRSGDVHTLPLAAEPLAQLKAGLTIGADQCHGKRCVHFDRCFFQKARAHAMQSDALLINHTLLLSDQRLFEKGMGAILPAAEAVIVDEAHQLPDLLVRRNTETMEEYAVQRWIKRVRRGVADHRGLFAALPEALTRLERLWQAIRTQLIAGGADEQVKTVSAASFTPLVTCLEQIHGLVEAVHLSSENMDEELQRVRPWLAMLKRAQTEQAVLYCDVDQNQLRIVAARLTDPFVGLVDSQVAWLFVSATLMVDRSFAYFKRCLSLPDIESHHHESALDYEQRSMLWVPHHLPLPSEEGFYHAWVESVLQVADRLEGGILMLFSSHDALRQAAQYVVGRTSRTVLVYQTDGNRAQLLKTFRQEADSILLATGSFWEGIDVQGAALRCVAIDKLPFAAPDDVLSLAWKYRAQQEGASVFNDYMVPHAVTRLRQGVGRLLRSLDDKGLVLLGDNRLLKKAYGGRFRQALPPLPMAESLAEVEAFLTRMGIHQAEEG